jgi:hypothetical protein
MMCPVGFRKVLRWAPGVTVFLAVAFGAITPSAARAADTTDYGPLPGRSQGVAVPFTGFTGPGGRAVPIWGAVGVDLVLGSTAQPYLPCKHYDQGKGDSDTFIDACVVPGSYTTYTRFSSGAGLLFPFGYFVGNVQPDIQRGGSLRTGWGQRTAGLSFEFYPEPDRALDYVHSRFYVDVFDRGVGGWSSSAPVGSIPVATLSDPGTTRLNGYVTDGGRTPAKGRVRFTVFGGTARSSSGYPISSFAVTSSTGQRYWTTGAMYAGPQSIRVDDTATGRSCTWKVARMTGTGNRWDFDLARKGFGHAAGTCT